MPTTDEGPSHAGYKPERAFESDLLQIAQAERGYIATTAIALRSTNSSPPILFPCAHERDVIPTRSNVPVVISPLRRGSLPAPAGSPIRYPNLAIDATMQVTKSTDACAMKPGSDCALRPFTTIVSGLVNLPGRCGVLVITPAVGTVLRPRMRRPLD